MFFSLRSALALRLFMVSNVSRLDLPRNGLGGPSRRKGKHAWVVKLTILTVPRKHPTNRTLGTSDRVADGVWILGRPTIQQELVDAWGGPAGYG